MNRDEIMKKILGKYYDEDLVGYFDSDPIISLSEVEEMISKTMNESKNKFTNNLDNIFNEFSNNGHSEEQLTVLRDFYQEITKSFKKEF